MGKMETKLIPLGIMARRLHVTCAWLRSEAEAGRIPALNAAGRLLFQPEAVERVLSERAAQPVPASGEQKP